VSSGSLLAQRVPPERRRDPDSSDVFGSLPVAALLIGPDNMIADANVRAEALLNMARSAIVGSDIYMPGITGLQFVDQLNSLALDWPAESLVIHRATVRAASLPLAAEGRVDGLRSAKRAMSSLRMKATPGCDRA